MEKLDALDEKFDLLQINVNELTVKELHNNTRIIELTRDLKKAACKME